MGLEPLSSSVTKSCLTLCDPMDCSTPGSTVFHCLPEFAQVHVGYPTISSSITLFSSRLQSFPASGSFPMSWLFPSGGQSIGASASASVLPTNIQVDSLRTDWFDLLVVQGTLKSLLEHHSSLHLLPFSTVGLCCSVIITV